MKKNVLDDSNVCREQVTRRVFLGTTAALVGSVATGVACSPREVQTVSAVEKSAGEGEGVRVQRSQRLPTAFIPHGGGPCFFMDWTMGPPDTWESLRGWLESFGKRHRDVKALLVISAHWEESVFTVQTGESPDLLFDYSGFPAHTYKLTWPAAGAPQVAARAEALMRGAGFEVGKDPRRGFDHGVFVPLKVAFPEAHIPAFQISLKRGLDPEEHLALGRALAPLRDEGVLIVGSGMSFHNLRAFMRGREVMEPSRAFDAWLSQACASVGEERWSALRGWEGGPNARVCHPREEHLIPLLVAAGAAEGEVGRVAFQDAIMKSVISAFEFGGVV